MDFILGIPHAREETDTHEFSRETQEKIQLTFEIARRDLRERAENQQSVDKALTSNFVFKSGQAVSLFRPYESTDGPNPNYPARG